MIDWEDQAAKLLKVELARSGISYKVLAAKLGGIGNTETESAINSKINRGKYQMAFFLQCMHALGVEEVTVALPSTKVQDGQKK